MNDDTREQAIEHAAKVLHDLEGCLDPFGTCRSTSDFFRDRARALADAGLLAGTANTTEAHGYSTWSETKLRAEVSRLNEEVMAHQVGDGYEKGYEHGSALAAQHKARADRAETDLAALRDKVRALADKGTGTDLNPTVLASTDTPWWYGYLRRHDTGWRERLHALLTDGSQS